jgi:hypothetical protein
MLFLLWSGYAPMHDTGAKTPGTDGVQLVIAAFDDWDALEAALGSIDADLPSLSVAVLHARAGAYAPPGHTALLSEMKELHFARAHLRVVCTAGQLADRLAEGVARGAHGLAHALGQWLNAHQARQLQDHIEHGRLILWLELRSADEFGTVCAQLVRASPHVVELGNIGFGT